ncbi:hypothetical protein AAEX63_07885 [Luteococcus sp. H138]|uniref:hypothetical protein n=1 Tax=unclassified Luteococcus TaxID=2639923 RepID=UPI00313BF871
MQWKKIVVILLGVALAASFGFGAVGASSPPRPSTPELLASYDQQAIGYWVSGRSSSPALADALKASRESFVGNGISIVQADSRSVAVSESEQGDRWEVRAKVNTSWVLRQDSTGRQETSTSTDDHRLVYDRDGELVSDEFVQG